MVNILEWPSEFENASPMTRLGDEFMAVLEDFTANGATVRADEHWSFFEIRHGEQAVDFVRRGRLGRGRPECWEVCIYTDGRGIKLGSLFGIRDCSCVVTAGLDNIRAIPQMLFDGAELNSIVAVIPFWDRMNPLDELSLPDSGIA